MKKKQIPIIILLVILVQITLQLIIPIHTIAAEEIVTIQCNDINFYNRLIEELEGQIQSKNDTEKTITMTKTNVESVTSINLGNSDDTNDSLKITDITGIKNFINLTNLRLYYNNISDISVLSGLTNLTDLDLASNEITDISALFGLTNLVTLNLRGNNISDIDLLAGLTNLSSLYLGSNGIRELDALSNLKKLERLHLEGNNLSDISTIANLINLRLLNLCSNNIENITPIGSNVNLETLYIGGNELNDISILKNLSKLTTLDIAGNNIHDISVLTQLNNLKSLILSSCTTRIISPNMVGVYGSNPLKDGYLEVISKLTGLKELCIEMANITNIECLSTLTNLTNLDLSSNEISDINALSGLTNLRTLYLRYNNISDISVLSGLTRLEWLSLGHNEIADISALSGLTNLSRLLYLEDNIIQRTIAKNGIQEIELPQIIKAAKDSNSKIYTEEEYILTNCSLSEDGTKIIVNTDEVTEASIQIQGGNADGTKFTANIIVDTTPPELEIEYSTTEPTEENVIVTIIANEEIQIPDGWIEGEDKNIIYKEYDANTEETVVIKDLAGNETEANIKIENIINKGNNGQNDDQTSGDETLADKEYPAAGIGKILLICIGVIIITGTIGFIKNKKYKNI